MVGAGVELVAGVCFSRLDYASSTRSQIGEGELIANHSYADRDG